jgi:ADP-ribosylation factor GTPase-activating protein 2/3
VTSSAAIRKAATVGAAGGARKTGVLGAKKSKLGVKKVVAADDLDFDAAEKKAKEEAERIAKLGYNPDDEEEAAAHAAKQAAAAAPSSMLDVGGPSIVSPTPINPGARGAASGPEKSTGDVSRLGMGVARLGFGQTATKQPAGGTAPKPAGFGGFGSVSRSAANDGKRLFPKHDIHCTDSSSTDAPSFARSKFGTQKGISSDEFFGRAAFDPSAQNEAKSRLNNFEGATSISSNAYFGRPEEDFNQEDYGDLESAAKDFVRRFGLTAGDDLENLTALVGDGATKLRGAVRNYLNS